MILSHMRGPSVTAARNANFIHYPPSRSILHTRRGNLTKETETLMENTQEELKSHLMQTDDEYRRLAEQHSQYHRQLEALEAKAHLSSEEEVEEHRLKK